MERQASLQTVFTEGNKYDSLAPGSIWGKPGEIILGNLDEIIKPDDWVAHLPCGDGRYENELCKRVGPNGRIIAGDVDRLGLERTRHINITEENREIVFPVQLNIVDLPFERESFDVFFSIGLLHFFTPQILQEKIFPEVDRVLKPGGTFFWNFPIDVTRTNLDDGTLLEFEGYEHKEDEAIDQVKQCFPKYQIEVSKVTNFTSDYENTEPPYRWNGDILVFRAQKG